MRIGFSDPKQRKHLRKTQHDQDWVHHRDWSQTRPKLPVKHAENAKRHSEAKMPNGTTFMCGVILLLGCREGAIRGGGVGERRGVHVRTHRKVREKCPIALQGGLLTPYQNLSKVEVSLGQFGAVWPPKLRNSWPGRRVKNGNQKCSRASSLKSGCFEELGKVLFPVQTPFRGPPARNEETADRLRSVTFSSATETL